MVFHSHFGHRLTPALLVSILLHALLIGLQFNGEGRGWLGLGSVMQVRRAMVHDLRVTLVQSQAAPVMAPLVGPAFNAPDERITVVARAADPSPLFSAVPVSTQPSHAIEPQAKDALPLKLSRELDRPPAPAQSPGPRQNTVPLAQTAATDPAKPTTEAMPAHVEAPPEPVATAPQPRPIAVAHVATSPFAVPTPTPATDEVAKQDAARIEAQRLDEERKEAARIEAARQEVVRVEAARALAAQQETERKEAARVEAARVESQRQEAIKQEAARIDAVRTEAVRMEALRAETAKREAARIEAARVEAVRQESQKLEAARVAAAQLEAHRIEAARAEAARVAAARAEAARRESEKIDAARQAAAKAEAARLQEEKDEDARREARRRNMARILEEEAQQRDSAKFAASKPILPLSLSSARRVRLLGRADPNEELVKYAESFARKIQLNTLPDTFKDIAKRKHTHPMVTVAVRSDGTIETVTLVVSSGVPEIDEAVRRIVQSHAPYAPFPPDLARDFDVAEIRRTWIFDVAVRLQ